MRELGGELAIGPEAHGAAGQVNHRTGIESGFEDVTKGGKMTTLTITITGRDDLSALYILGLIWSRLGTTLEKGLNDAGYAIGRDDGNAVVEVVRHEGGEVE